MKNKAKILSAIAMNKVAGKKIPLRVILKLTKRCNLRCKHCLEWRFQGPDVPFEKIKQMLDKLAKAGATHLSINGGEPLIRKDIGEIIRYAKKLGLSIGFTSNGTFIPHKINEIKDVDILGLSLDGPKEIHDFLRGDGQYDDVMKALDIAKKNGIKNIYLNTVLTKNLCKNLDSIDEIVAVAKRNNVDCNFVTMYGDVKDGIIQKPSDEELKLALRRIIELKKMGAPILYSLLNYEYCLKWPDFSKEKYFESEKHNIKGPIKCKAGELAIAVEANGDVYPCNMVKNEVQPENIFSDKSVSEIMKNVCNKNKCKYCYYGCYVEANALFSLDPKIIREYLKKS
jgi:MoaA/NifB/PqqE/SkfB family radical SAM enzyme